MGLGGWLSRSLVYTVTNTDDPEFLQSFTVNGPPLLAPDWGEAGAYRGGMSIPGAWAAALFRADLVAKLPWHLFRERADGTTERLRTPSILLQPDPPATRMVTIGALALDLIWHGNGIAQITSRNADGSPSAFTPIPADRVEVARLPRTGRVVYRIDGDPNRQLDYVDVLHIQGPTRPGELRGMGVLEFHLAQLSASRGLARQSNNVAHGVPTGILEAPDPDVTPEELASAKRSWMDAQNTRTIAALAPGVKFTPISWRPDEMQLVEARKFDLAQLALIFRIPGYWIGADSQPFTYSSADWEGRNLLKYTAVGADVERFDQALSLLFPRGQFVRANTDAILRGSTRERYETHQLGIQGGFLLKSEARAFEDLPPVPGIDDPPAPPEPPAAVTDDQDDPTEEIPE